MSGRVVDKMQIDRHYAQAELAELYSYTPCDLEDRPVPNMPDDELLKALLHEYPNIAYKYLEHDMLLENKPDQKLNEDEIKEAWALYKKESHQGNTRRRYEIDPVEYPTDPQGASENYWEVPDNFWLDMNPAQQILNPTTLPRPPLKSLQNVSESTLKGLPQPVTSKIWPLKRKNKGKKKKNQKKARIFELFQ